jgi:PAS domain S-box-containing protein
MPVSSSEAKSQNADYEQLKSLINSMTDAVIAVDESFKIVLTNGSALNLLDTNIALTGRNVDRALTIVDARNQEVSVSTLIRENKLQFVSRDLKFKYSDQSTINLYMSISPVSLSYGQKGKRGHVILLRDITREISLEQERDEFISVVSHELRTPIAISEGNISNAQLIFKNSGIQNDFIDTALTHAHEQIVFLAGLVNDLATLSRADKGTLKTEVATINVVKLLTELNEIYSPQALAKGLSLDMTTDPHLELLKSSDLYLREILQNFITNAIKYTSEGSVHITASAKNSGVEFHIADTGIGISKADQEMIFDKFYRAENHLTREQNGTGLGLYVTMKLAGLIHAEISVSSVLGKGSDFFIQVPNLT